MKNPRFNCGINKLNVTTLVTGCICCALRPALPKHELVFQRKKPQMGQASITPDNQCSGDMDGAQTAHLPWACSPASLQDSSADRAAGLLAPSAAPSSALGPQSPCSGHRDAAAIALQPQHCSHSTAAPSTTAPSASAPAATASLHGEQQQDGKDAALGRTALPVIALESLGILPHEINAGAIMANLFYTDRTVLGTSPSTGCEVRQGGRSCWSWTPRECQLRTPRRHSATPQRSCMPLQPQCKT